MGENIMIPSDLAEYVSKAKLVDMIDFSRTAFNKEFKTSVSSVEKFDSKFPLVKLGSLINGTPQYGANQKAVEGNPLMDYRYIRITDINEDGTLNDDWKTVAEVEKQYILKEGDVLFARSGATAGKAFYYKNEYGKALYAGYLIRFRFDESKVIPLFVYNLLCSKEYNDWVEKTKGGTARQNINSQQYCSFEIPLPPMDIQKKIVEECEKIDQVVTKNKEMIREMQTNMEAIISSLEGLRQPLKTIMCYGKERISYSAITPEKYVSTDNMEQNCEGIVPYNGTPNVNTIVAYQKGDILLSNIRPYLKKLWLANCNGGCSPDVLVLHNNRPAQVDSSFIYYSLRRQGFFDFIMSDIKGMKMPRGKKETIEKFEIILPSLDKQKEVVEKMSKIDEEISKAKQYVANASSAKQAILDKYLK